MKRCLLALTSLLWLSACDDETAADPVPRDAAWDSGTTIDAGALPDGAANAAASSAPADATVPDTAQSQVGEFTGGAAPTPQCQFTLWTKPEEIAKRFDCTLNPSGATCTCDGKRVDTAAPNPPQCVDAIAKACSVDTSARTYCEHGYGGGCWPSASGSDAWLCECSATKQRMELHATSCRSAGASLCKPPATSCESNIGRCRPGASGNYDCECPHDAPALRTLSADTCESALENACAETRTQAGTGGPCMSATGFCDGKGREPGDGFVCQCQDASGLIVRQGKPIAPSCEKALAFYCASTATK